jgi:class 3 adenylate cyclase/predicted ATPase
MDIGGWLRELGLGQYEAAFRDNAVDAAILPKLTGDYLKEIGVLAVGHRRRLLDAIATLGLSGDSSGAPAPRPSRPVAPAAPAGLVSAASAERRPITVMFCDLVGSTSLAATLDPEDWRNLLGSYLDSASAAVTSLGGHVLKKLGDGLMALFGYPQAQENDGERAVRAALAIQRALADLNARNAATGAPELAARIGLESGRVVVDHTGEVYGEAPNVAARVQSAAAPGEIWITRAVHRQIAGLFVAEDKGAHELKGVPEKTQLYRIVRVSGGGRRGGSRAPTPLVGRGEELDILTRRWERARRGEGQLALITGEPGLGKSRLIEEFRARLAETPHTWVEWASSQLLQNTPLHPVAEWGRARFGGAEVAGERRYAELEAALGSVGLDSGEYAPLLAPVIDAPTPPERAPKLSPEELRSRQLAALTAWLLAGARTQPLVFAFEDLHWADPTSLDVLQALAERGAQAPLLIIATTRPEFRPPWKLRSHHGVISLAPLDAGEVARMVGEIATRHALSKDVIAGVSERSGGVPLFVEEVTRLLLERGEHGGVQAIPPTLQQSLAARLDRLGPAREIAQIGAVLGRGFSHALLQAVAGLDEPALRAALDRLADAELLFVEGVAPHASYRFKHALIQDAAYDSLLKSRRQTLHRRAAEVLLASPAPEAEALAHHFTLGGQTELAIEWWGKAGDQALRRSAFAEAISHLGKAIELSDKAGGAAKPREAAAAAPVSQRLKLQTDYGQAVMWSKGYAAEETKAAFARVEELAIEIDNAEAPLDAYYARWVHNLWRGALGSARETAESFLREAERAARPAEAAAAHRILGLALLWQGDFEEACAHFEQTLRFYDAERDRDAKYRVGGDARAAATSHRALAAWCLGDVARARKLGDEAGARAAESAHGPTLANTYCYLAVLDIIRNDAEAARRDAEAIIAAGREHGLASYLTYGALTSAWARAKLDDHVAGSAEFRQALAEHARQGNKFQTPFYQALLAEIEAEGGAAESALAGVDEALALAGETGEHWFDARLHSIRGEILLEQDPIDSASAEAAFLAAIAVAQRQKVRSFELRAALSLAKLYQSTGRPIDAYDVLGPALAGFSPTTEFPTIAEAEQLFAELAENDAVKAIGAARQQHVKLHVAYGNALMAARGHGDPATVAAFGRAHELAIGAETLAERSSIYYGRWSGAYVPGELDAMRELAQAFLRDCESDLNSGEACVALRINGVTKWFAGEFVEARDLFERALATYDPQRDRDLVFRFGQDIGVPALGYSALLLWALGEIDLARERAEALVQRCRQNDNAATSSFGFMLSALYEIQRRNAAGAAASAASLKNVASAHGMSMWAGLAVALDGYVDWHAGNRARGLATLRRGLDIERERGAAAFVSIVETALAEIEAEAGEIDAALGTISHAIAECERTQQRWFSAETHRIHGEILLKQNPADPAAEAAFLASIAVAQQQKARSFELRAALSLAKLYQSTGRPTDAHEILGPALAGFSPTPEFPQIAEAKDLLAAIEATGAHL